MDWLTSLFQPGAAGAAGAYGVPGQSPTMMYPFNPPAAQDFPAPPPMPEGGVAGGALPTAPPPMAYSQAAATGSTNATPAGAPSDKLLTALRGVTAPPRPEAQKVSTPHLAAPGKIQGGELINMLSALGIGPRDVYQLPKLGMPRGM